MQSQKDLNLEKGSYISIKIKLYLGICVIVLIIFFWS